MNGHLHAFEEHKIRKHKLDIIFVKRKNNRNVTETWEKIESKLHANNLDFD